MKKVYVFLADGFEMVEALTPVDVLRRAGMDVVTVSISNSYEVRSSHDVVIKADKLMSEIDKGAADLLVLPGGMPGTNNLAACKELMDMVIDYNSNGKLISAICAAPAVVFGETLQILKGKKAICYPGMEDKLIGADVVYEEVIVDGNIITSRGMGTAIPFALKLLEILTGDSSSAPQMAEKIVFHL